VVQLTRVACVLALLGLSLMSYSLLDPRAVPVIVAMSLGHAFGFGAFGCYLLAVVVDVWRSGGPPAQAAAGERAELAPRAGADERTPTPRSP
jgi:hypothetical protein